MNDDNPIPIDPDTKLTESALPRYETEVLAAMSVQELVARLMQDEIRAPRILIDECARRGDAMIDVLREALDSGRAWEDDADNGEWCLLLHAAMILGLMPDERAGLLLAQHLRRITEEDDDDMQDWLSGSWPALFRNKPETVLPALRALTEDQTLDWFARTDALDSILAYADKLDTPARDATLDWAAAIAADESEDWDVRNEAGSGLLAFAPARHRALLEQLTRNPSPFDSYFSAQAVADAYAGKPYVPHWAHLDNPWDIYDPAAIEERWQEWLQQQDELDNEGEVPALDGDYGRAFSLPFVREQPKVGRNEPCPCGSGKKFKKCCLEK